jgi:hypothetical protein
MDCAGLEGQNKQGTAKMLHSGGTSQSIPAAIESPLRKDSGVTSSTSF